MNGFVYQVAMGRTTRSGHTPPESGRARFYPLNVGTSVDRVHVYCCALRYQVAISENLRVEDDIFRRSLVGRMLYDLYLHALRYQLTLLNERRNIRTAIAPTVT